MDHYLIKHFNLRFIGVFHLTMYSGHMKKKKNLSTYAYKNYINHILIMVMQYKRKGEKNKVYRAHIICCNTQNLIGFVSSEMVQ